MRKGKRMRLRRMIVMLAAVAGLGLGLPSAMPAAYAASAAPAAHLIARAPAVAQAASVSTAQTSDSIPLIQFRECSGTTTSWVDLDILLTLLQDWCFGYKGTWTFSRNYDVTNFCAGNNEGRFSYYLPDGQLTGFNFGPGYRKQFPAGSQPYQLTITGWYGETVCNS